MKYNCKYHNNYIYILSVYKSINNEILQKGTAISRLDDKNAFIVDSNIVKEYSRLEQTTASYFIKQHLKLLNIQFFLCMDELNLL